MCRLAGFGRAAWYRPSRAKDQSALRMRIRELTLARPRLGYNRIHIVVRREGWRVNLKRIRRLYRLEDLQVRLGVRKQRHWALHRGPVPASTGLQQRWNMDFEHDQLADGRAFCVRSVIDQWSRLSFILEVVQRVTGADVALEPRGARSVNYAAVRSDQVNSPLPDGARSAEGRRGAQLMPTAQRAARTVSRLRLTRQLLSLAGATRRTPGSRPALR